MLEKDYFRIIKFFCTILKMVIVMKVQLGYVASPLTLDKITYSHTMTYKTYSNLSSSEAQKKTKRNCQ